MNKINKLCEKIQYYNHKYYDLGESEISDYEYDQLVQELKELTKNSTDDLPINHVGGNPDSNFPRHEHDIPMLSIQDYFNPEDLNAYIVNILKKYVYDTYSVEPKVDGVSACIRYENGKYVGGYTRGNGYVGDDITENLSYVDGFPHILNAKGISLLEVRGEVYMNQTDFKILNDLRESEGETLFKNARNCAAGTIKSKDPSVVKNRKLKFIAFNVQQISGIEFKTHAETLEFLKANNFNVIPFEECEYSEVEKFVNQIREKRFEYPYGIDGAVIKLNDLSGREELGSTEKCPRWAAAFKFLPEQAETIVRDIKVQVGRTGRLTPVAVFDSVTLAGTNVAQATLHNQAQIDRLDIGIGDSIIVQKAGDIIPEIYKVLHDKRPDGVETFKIPDYCPVCLSEVEKDGEDYRCINPLCHAQIEKQIQFFCSRPCMDIFGMGIANCHKLVREGYIYSITDIYRLKDRREEIINTGLIGKKKSVDKLLAAIEDSKTGRPLPRFIKALGNKGIGEKAGEILVKEFGSLENIMEADVAAMENLKGIGPIMAKNIYDFFHTEEIIGTIEEFKMLGVTWTIPENKAGKLDGKTFAYSGSFEIKRKELIALIKENGGIPSGTVTKKCDYLICGENAGSKRDKAKEYNIPIISLDDFMEIIHG